MYIERRRFCQAMASEWQTAFVVSQNAMVCLVYCRQELQLKSWKLQDFFFKTETKNKTKCSRPRPGLHDPRPRASRLVWTWSLGLHHCSQRITYDMGTTIPTRRYNYPVIRINPHIIRIMTRILGARYSAGTRNYRLSALWVVCADFRQAQVGSKPG